MFVSSYFFPILSVKLITCILYIMYCLNLWLLRLQCIYRHETPQIEISNAHDNNVWDLAWHPIGYLLCRWTFYFSLQ